MKDKVLAEAKVFYIKKPGLVIRDILFLTRILNERDIMFSFIYTAIELDIIKASNESLSKPQVNFYLFEKILWVFVEDIQDNFNLFEEIEETMVDSIENILVTNKNILNEIFKSQFSDNLIEANIGGDDLYEFEESLLVGTHINKSDVYLKLFQYTDIFIYYLKIQPCNINTVITLRMSNKIEFEKVINREDLNYLIVSFNKIILTAIEKITYINKGEKL